MQGVAVVCVCVYEGAIEFLPKGRFCDSLVTEIRTKFLSHDYFFTVTVVRFTVLGQCCQNEGPGLSWKLSYKIEMKPQ